MIQPWPDMQNKMYGPELPNEQPNGRAAQPSPQKSVRCCMAEVHGCLLQRRHENPPKLHGCVIVRSPPHPFVASFSLLKPPQGSLP